MLITRSGKSTLMNPLAGAARQRQVRWSTARRSPTPVHWPALRGSGVHQVAAVYGLTCGDAAELAIQRTARFDWIQLPRKDSRRGRELLAKHGRWNGNGMTTVLAHGIQKRLNALALPTPAGCCC